MTKTICIKIALCIIALVLFQSYTLHFDVDTAIMQAHRELWDKFIDQYGIIHGYVGEIPTPEDCTLGRPNAIGWRSPISDGAFFTGLYLPAMCEKARRSKSQTDRDNARRLADGLLKCASVSDVHGFIARGVGIDGKCHYPVGSVDQTVPWYLGLYAYVTSDIPTDEHRQIVIDKLNEVTDALLALDWKLPCDGQFKGEFRGDLKSNNYLEVTAYLFLLRMMYQLTHNNLYLEEYMTALFEHPRGSVEQPLVSERTRIEICAESYHIDSVIFNGNMDKSTLWIYVKNQAALVYLIAMENDETIRESYRLGLVKNAQNALNAISDYKKFDNNDIKIFGHAKWREGFPLWFRQETQADAEKLSGMGNNAILGERRGYEKSFMTNPLAAAAIVALSGDNSRRKIIEQAILHYDYSKLNLSEFFFAEVAYYSLTTK